MPPSPLPIDSETADLLNRVLELSSFMPGLKAEHLRSLFPRSGLFAYPPQAVVVEQGEEGRDLFVICLGKAEVQQGYGSAMGQIAVLDSGSIIGEIALLRGHGRTATVVTTEESRIYRLSYEDIQYILANNPPLAAHLTQLASERLGLP